MPLANQLDAGFIAGTPVRRWFLRSAGRDQVRPVEMFGIRELDAI